MFRFNIHKIRKLQTELRILYLRCSKEKPENFDGNAVQFYKTPIFQVLWMCLLSYSSFNIILP